MSRALLVAASVCLAVADSDLRSVCRGSVCPDSDDVVCCFNGMAMDAQAGTCSDGATTCGLCGQADLDGCPECPGSVSPFLANGPEDDVWCVDDTPPTPAPLFAAAGALPLHIKRTDGSSTALATFNGMRGWENVPTSTFQGFQEFLLGLTAHIPHFTQRSQYQVSLRCNKETIGTAKGCSFFFFVYRCPPCAAHTGILESRLLSWPSPVWSVNPCGPTFQLHPEGVVHQFALYSTEVTAPYTFSIELMQDIAFTWWALIGQEVVCSSLATEAQCKANPVNCVWDELVGDCITRGCEENGGHVGPGVPRCAVCVDDELIPTTPYAN